MEKINKIALQLIKTMYAITAFDLSYLENNHHYSEKKKLDTKKIDDKADFAKVT